jgi:hypothetical protein
VFQVRVEVEARQMNDSTCMSDTFGEPSMRRDRQTEMIETVEEWDEHHTAFDETG